MTTRADFDHAQQTVCDWLRQNGIDPNGCPFDTNVVVTNNTVTLDVVVLDEHGRPELGYANDVVTTRRTYPLTTPPPDNLDDLLTAIREWRL